MLPYRIEGAPEEEQERVLTLVSTEHSQRRNLLPPICHIWKIPLDVRMSYFLLRQF